MNLAKGFPLQSIASYLESIPDTTNSAVLCEKLADIYSAQGKPSSSIEFTEKALRLDPSPQQRVRLRLTLAERLVEQDRTQDTLRGPGGVRRGMPGLPRYAGHLPAAAIVGDQARGSGTDPSLVAIAGPAVTPPFPRRRRNSNPRPNRVCQTNTDERIGAPPRGAVSPVRDALGVKKCNRKTTLPIGRTARVAYDLDVLRGQCSRVAENLLAQPTLNEAELEECARLDDALAQAQKLLKGTVSRVMISRLARRSGVGSASAGGDLGAE